MPTLILGNCYRVTSSSPPRTATPPYGRPGDEGVFIGDLTSAGNPTFRRHDGTVFQAPGTDVAEIPCE